MRGKGRCLAACAALALLLTGCSLDVEAFLQPPRMQGEQQAIQQGLETYLRDSGLSQSGRYTLKYPTEGTHTSAFVLCDGTGAPVEETKKARMAVAFYSLSSAPEETHINLLSRTGDEWVSIGDRLGSGTEIRQVTFGDLDGDGSRELLAGWSTYNSRDHRLAVYSMVGELSLMGDDRLYTGLYVGRLTHSQRDDILLFHIGGDEQVTVSMETLQAGQVHTVDTVALDRQIRQFGRMAAEDLTAEVRGLYVDALKSDNTTITELIYYDGKGLHAPFNDAAAGTTTLTGRIGGLGFRDVDGDGHTEVPVCRPLPVSQEEPKHITGMLTVWCRWDYATRTMKEVLTTVANPEDGYLVLPDATMLPRLATRYNESTRSLTLYWSDTGADWLWLCAGGNSEAAPRMGLTPLALFEDGNGIPTCVAWYDAAYTDTEKVRYMLLRLTEEGG